MCFTSESLLLAAVNWKEKKKRGDWNSKIFFTCSDFPQSGHPRGQSGNMRLRAGERKINKAMAGFVAAVMCTHTPDKDILESSEWSQNSI